MHCEYNWFSENMRPEGRTGAFSCSSSALPQQISVVVVILICLELQPNQDVKVNHDSITQRELLANTKTVSLHYI